MKHLIWGHLSISGISQLLLTQCWPNFKGRFLEPSLTDANRYGDICPVNIGYCLNSDQPLKVDYKRNVNVNFLEPDYFTWNFCTPNFFGPQFSLDQIFFNLNLFNLNFLDNNFLDHLFYLPKMFGSNTFWPTVFGLGLFLDQQFFFIQLYGHGLFLDQNFVHLISFWTKNKQTRTTTTTTTLMCFDTIEINLVYCLVFGSQDEWYFIL